MAPTFVSYSEHGSWVTTYPTGQVFSAAVTVETGDLLLVFSGTGNGNRDMSTASGGGLTYTLRLKPNADNDTGHSDCWFWTAVATANDSFNVQSTFTSPITTSCGICVYVWRDATLGAFIGIEDAGTVPLLDLTTTGDGSAVTYFQSDWNSVNAARTWRTINSITPTAGNGFEKLFARSGTSQAVYSAYWGDVGTAGVKTTGLSAPTGELPNAIAVEVLAEAAAPSVMFLRPTQSNQR